MVTNPAKIAASAHRVSSGAADRATDHATDCATDSILLQVTPLPGQSGTDLTQHLAAHLPRVFESLPELHRAQLGRMAWAAPLGNQGQLYAYLDLPSTTALSSAVLISIHRALEHTWRTTSSPGSALSRLERRLHVPGVFATEIPRFHYVVETDPEDGWLTEISRWYDLEHMPGLAAVPGCVLAMRFVNHDARPGHPHLLACYDLTQASTLGSEPWLAVRNTAWSDIARPHFTNTRRNMFAVEPAP